MGGPSLDLDDAAAEIRLAAAVTGPLAALGLAGALVALRSELGLANVGFIMMLVVLGAGAAGGRVAGIVTAVVAALAFNLFHTQPYLSLEVAARQDAISVGLLAVAGAVVGEVGARAGRRRRALARSRVAQQDFDTVLQAIADGAPLERTWQDLRACVLTHAGAERCTFQRRTETADTSAEELARTFVLPVVADGDPIGHLLVTLPVEVPSRAAADVVARAATMLALTTERHGAVPDELV